jgi:DNA-binding MarR family transcriptional regulator
VLQSMLAVATPDLCKLDVTMGQVKAMLAIGLKDDVTIGFIAQTMGTGLPAASTNVDRLVNLCWVTRAEDPADRRRAIVALTPSGREIVERVWRLRRDLLREWLSRMEEQGLSVLAQGIAALKSASADSTLDERMVAAAG